MRRSPALVLALVVVTACGSSGGSSGGAPGSTATNGPGGTATASIPTTEGVTLAAATGVGHLAGTDRDAASAGAAIDAFAMDLYPSVAGDGGNLAFSPASIATVLAMARAGARGATAAEMDTVLHGLGSDAHAGWVAALDLALNARSGSFGDADGVARDATLRIANAPFVQRGLTLQPTYLDALAARFGAGVRLVDFASASEAARTAINAWVGGQTSGRIPQLLGPGVVTDATRLVLVNAIYLNAAWQTPFNPELTRPAAFRRPDGTSVDVQMMSNGGTLPYGAGKGWQAVELPYVGGKLAMLVIVPDDLASFGRAFDGATLTAIVASLKDRQVALGLPRFGARTNLDLTATLGAMGMPTAFSGAADFSGISSQEALAITAVVHQAYIDVGERGTEAAAATGAPMAASSFAADDLVSLTVDRPFLFALRDLDSGAVLFLGRITDPSVGAPAS